MSEDGSARLPAKLEVSALLRATQAAGGFATVLHKGEEQGGTILVVTTVNGKDSKVYERMPNANGGRTWALAKAEVPDNIGEFSEYLTRRTRQDPDLWVIELDIAQGERLIGLSHPVA